MTTNGVVFLSSIVFAHVGLRARSDLKYERGVKVLTARLDAQKPYPISYRGAVESCHPIGRKRVDSSSVL